MPFVGASTGDCTEFAPEPATSTGEPVSDELMGFDGDDMGMFDGKFNGLVLLGKS